MSVALRPNNTNLTLDELTPRKTDRALFVGMTGSGKTTLAQILLRSRGYVVAVDFKGLLKWPGYEVHTGIGSLARAKAPRLIYRPNYDEIRNEEIQEQVWEWLYRRGNTTVYVDETAAVTEGNVYPFYYGACLMRGREHGIELWSATQRPARIPSIVLSESEHVFAFRLRLPQDRERVEALTMIERESIAVLPKHEFLYAPQDGDIVGPLRLNLPG